MMENGLPGRHKSLLLSNPQLKASLVPCSSQTNIQLVGGILSAYRTKDIVAVYASSIVVSRIATPSPLVSSHPVRRHKVEGRNPGWPSSGELSVWM